MLKYVKRQILELLQTVEEARQDVVHAIEAADGAGLMNILADSQEAAVAIGGRIEETEGLTERETVGLLEGYCEMLWRMTQEQDPGIQKAVAEEAWGLLEDVERRLEQMPEQIAAVFMPYKASMWDSLESVWQAACKDPECVPFVVPIPYYDLKDGQMTERHYEGENFPDYVPVIHYSEFPLEELHPEIVFIHNPFDDCNTVTTVLPQYYSSELKKVAKKVVYIPYFITGDAVYVTHRYFPSYDRVDFIVTQCEKTIDSFAAELPREKFLPYGSPIADRVLRLEREKPDIPEEWKAQLKNGRDFGGDRAVMLNTSITKMMGEGERFLEKLEYLMELAKRQKGISLVWRPHPLLAATAKNMGENYAERLARLEDKFLREKIGVLDKTPDVGVTVALCDAYLGETASSVRHMFGIAGKPTFYIDMRIWEENSEGKADKTAGIFASAHCQAGSREYYVLDEPGWIVEKEPGTEKYLPVVRIPGREIVWGRAYRGMEMKEDSLWLYPESAEGIFTYHPGTGRMRKVFGAGGNRNPQNAVPGESGEYIEVDEECLAFIKAEKFKRGNRDHVWYESESSRPDDFFRFLRTAGDGELTGTQGAYPVWLANLDGTCGEKVLQAVKASCAVG